MYLSGTASYFMEINMTKYVEDGIERTVLVVVKLENSAELWFRPLLEVQLSSAEFSRGTVQTLPQSR